jgi:hypothetical protein
MNPGFWVPIPKSVVPRAVVDTGECLNLECRASDHDHRHVFLGLSPSIGS